MLPVAPEPRMSATAQLDAAGLAVHFPLLWGRIMRKSQFPSIGSILNPHPLEEPWRDCPKVRQTTVNK
jgi:hypothetical protein